jgi:hypothetical protein
MDKKIIRADHPYLIELYKLMIQEYYKDDNLDNYILEDYYKQIEQKNYKIAFDNNKFYLDLEN